MMRKRIFAHFLIFVLAMTTFSYSVPVPAAAAVMDTVSFTPGDAAETAYLYGADTGDLLEHGTRFRLTEGSRYFTYRFTKPQGTLAMLTLTLAMQYKIKVSTDYAQWTTVLTSSNNGSFKEDRTIDLSPFFASSGQVFVRVEDEYPSDGWGGQVWQTTLKSIAPGSSPAVMQLDLSNGWNVSVDGGASTVMNAGDAVNISASSTARYSKTVSIPTWWQGQPISLTFSGITGNGTLFVDGALKGTAPAEQQPFTFTVTDTEMQDGVLQIAVDVYGYAGQTGTVSLGLWNSVRIGFSELVSTINIPIRSFNGTSVKISNQYNHIDTVTMNWLGGNYMQSLYDNRYKLIGFDGYTRKKELYYVHDTLRTMSAIAEEDMYSPIVRYDLMKNLYQGVKNALVPGSIYEFFLKRDQRPKRIRGAADVASSLEASSDQDVTEPYANFRFWGRTSSSAVVDSGSSTWSDGLLAYTNGQYSFRRTYTQSGANIYADVKYWNGDMDTPSQVTLSTGSGMSQLTAVLDNFDQRWQGARYTQVELQGGTTYNSTGGHMVISNPTAKYLILKTGSTGWVKSILVLWDGSPAVVRVNASADGQYFYSVEITYNTWGAGVTTKLVPFEWFDPNMNWPRSVANNILSTGKYGANGFDPTYSCNLEGLGPMGTAAAAQILKKYGDALAGEAEILAKNVLDGAVQAETRGAKSHVLNGPIAACEYLIQAGNTSYTSQLRTWADQIISEQAADGTWPWYDLQTRNMVALLKAYRSTQDSKYLNAYNKARSSMTYSNTGVGWKGTTVTASLPLHGGADLGFLGYMGDWTAISQLSSIQDHYFNDSGIWNCSDINPYFVGFSLRACNLVPNQTGQRVKLTMNQFATYWQNTYTISRYPTHYINNPNYGF